MGIKWIRYLTISFFFVIWYNWYGDSMEYIILGLLIVILVLIVVLLLGKNNTKNTDERINKLEISLIKEIGEFKNDFSHSFLKIFI